MFYNNISKYIYHTIKNFNIHEFFVYLLLNCLSIYYLYSIVIGIDAGGLRRDFFDLVGETIKDSKMQLFSPITYHNDERYYINKNI